MAKPEWGAKHTCANCGAKFYEMGRDPVTCPACETPVATAAPTRARRVRKEEVKPEETVAPVAAEAASDSEDDINADDVDDLIEDDDEDDAIVALEDDEEDGDDDLLVEADIPKTNIGDES